jgi:cytoskeletal protein CcmA (bactofilin family)
MSTTGADQRPATTGDTGRMPAATPQSTAATATERKIAVLGPTLRFKGDLSAEEDFILQGRIHGSIHHAQKIIVGTQGAVLGNIYARVVVVDGNVQGDLHGIESVVVHETGRVVGNIFAPRIGLSEGAVFNGRIDMSGNAVASQTPNQSSSQGSNPNSSHSNSQSGHQAATPVVAPITSSGPRRVESAMMSPGQPMSAEETEKVLSPKVVTVLPPPRRETTG